MISYVLATALLVMNSAPCELNAVRVDGRPSIDGVLDDSVWLHSEVESCNFIQYGPDFGQPMSEPTDIYVIYDDKQIYFGFAMSDPDPSTMMAGLTPRDNYVTGEWIAILLDSYNDGRQATSFEVSLANSQMDAKVNPNGHWDYSWDGVWESGTAQTASGWTAEIAIPFSCLRFEANDAPKTWGINFQRILSKTLENGWFVLTESRQMADLENFASLHGISGIERSLGAEVRPYAASRRFYREDGANWEGETDIGADLKLGVSTGVAADLAVNPDFGQVEADAVEMNLSHFELFLNEKRPFFLESQNVFQMPHNLFYSRRIGAVASNGAVIPIIAGGKISGSLGGNVRMGVLNAVTGRVWEGDELIEPAANYAIMRGYKQVGSHGFYGLSLVSKEIWEQKGVEASFNRAVAFDGAVELPGRNLLNFAAARSSNTDLVDDNSFRFNLERIQSTTTYALGARHVGENFNVNGTGYTTETGYRESWLRLHQNVRPDRFFSEIGGGAGFTYSQQIDGAVTGRNGFLEGNASLKNGAHMGINISMNGNRFDPYEGPEGHSYDGHIDYFIHAGSNPFNPFRIWAGIGGGDYSSGGTFGNYQTQVRLRPSAAFDVSLEASHFRTRNSDTFNWSIEEFDRRATDWSSLILRTNYIFNPDMNLRLFSQLSRFEMDYQQTDATISREFRTNMLFSWQFLPGSMIYLLLEGLFEADESGSFQKPDLGIYGKVSWYLPV